MRNDIVSAAVDRFFQRVLDDPTLAPWFDGAELHDEIVRQRAFVATTLVGDAGLADGSRLPAPVTAGQGTEAAIAAHLAAALREVGVRAASVDAVVAAVLRSGEPAGELDGLPVRRHDERVLAAA